LSRRTILVVEDNPLTRKMLRVALEVGGYVVREAGDGHAALQEALVGALDMAVVDFVLPDCDGLGLLAEIREKLAAPGLPALLVTGMVSRIDELRAKAGESTQVVPKPIEPSRLIEIVRAHLTDTGPKVGTCRILVVDDEHLNRKLTALRLERLGYQVDTATGGGEALRKAQAVPPDAILADVMMPGMDGFDFCRKVRADPALKGLPVVLVSAAYGEAADHDLAQRVGASELVLRSGGLEEVVEALARVTQKPQPPVAVQDEQAVDVLHRERLHVQLERQNERNRVLMQEAAIQATALSVIRGLSEALARPEDASRIIGDVLVHCLDATGLSTGLVYLRDSTGRHYVEAQFGIAAQRRQEAEDCFGHADLIQRVADRGEPCAFSVASTEATDEGRALLARLGHASVLLVPFIVLGRNFGTLLLASDAHDLSQAAWLGFGRSLSAQFGQTVALGQSLTRLASSEGRLRALMEQASDAIFVLSSSGDILEANQQAQKLLALPREELVGRHISQFAPGASSDVPENVRQFREGVAAGGGHPEGVRLLRGDGTEVEVDFSMSVHEIGGEAYVLSIGRDVTERNRAASALRQAQQRLQYVVSSSPAVLYTLQPDPRDFIATWVSHNVERLLGFTAQEVRAPGWWSSHVHPEDKEEAAANLAMLFHFGRVTQKYRCRNRQGDYRWLRADMRVSWNVAGEAVEAIGSWVDVSEQKDAERRTQESEEQYRLLFESNPHPMYVFDEQTLAFLAANEAAARQYAYSRQEFLAMTIEEVWPAEEIPSLLRALQSDADDRGPSRSLGMFRHRRKDGATVQMDVAASRIRFQGRGAWLTLAVDVTEKQSLEAQLQQAQKMESIGRLAGGVAHDFNNILGVIIGYGGMLRRRVKDDPTLYKYADDVVHAAERAAVLTRQLLAFSRKQVLQPRLLELNAVVGETERMLRRIIGEDIELVTRFNEVPHIRADPGQLEQVVMNLVVNARDAMPRGGHLLIETGVADLDERYAATHAGVTPGRHTVLSVTDDGEGMTPEVVNRIFEPFYTTKEAGKGTGLGLATVHGIVKQSGGHVFVYSEPGCGTSFKVYLPADAEKPGPVTPAAEEEPPRGCETVLVVEDEAALRDILRESLNELGYEVLAARHGAAAIEISQHRSGPIHLLLTDVVVPGIGGTEIARQLSAYRPEIKVLYMSGYTDDAVILKGVLTAEMPFLGKPFTIAALARKVREVLDRR
jgi:two-component system, cell cycle sensor histidine kinase and response regulator CckA